MQQENFLFPNYPQFPEPHPFSPSAGPLCWSAHQSGHQLPFPTFFLAIATVPSLSTSLQDLYTNPVGHLSNSLLDLHPFLPTFPCGLCYLGLPLLQKQVCSELLFSCSEHRSPQIICAQNVHTCRGEVQVYSFVSSYSPFTCVSQQTCRKKNKFKWLHCAFFDFAYASVVIFTFFPQFNMISLFHLNIYEFKDVDLTFF